MPAALVTGAGRGIGLATARAFLAAGWKVLALDKQFGAEVAGERVDYDLTDLAGIPALIARLGAIDTLVNNAGVLYCEPYDAIPEAHVAEILAVNLRAPVALIEALAPQMRQRKSGRIVNLGSVAAFTGHPDLWYGATKAALLNVTKSYAAHLGRDGILVNAVAPGPTLTPMYEQLPQSRKDGVMRTVHAGRACTPEEVARVVVWLGSSSPEYMSGSTVDVNSGSYPR
ncbi:MAG: SDR family oxidoreductase [Betaproteobacteria bacterium]|nr:SDR family oxidoreductase [Betaproteobacteria bacterium]MDH5221595.1 SDR family oxidoreductase [Betaproteobacteria bacterium]MDH5349844.1 SDR family oxidoreductase [Betaproteobacteria bacterium]